MEGLHSNNRQIFSCDATKNSIRGIISLTYESFKWEPIDKKTTNINSKEKEVSWASVAKHQVSPASHKVAMLKITLVSNEKDLIFKILPCNGLEAKGNLDELKKHISDLKNRTNNTVQPSSSSSSSIVVPTSANKKITTIPISGNGFSTANNNNNNNIKPQHPKFNLSRQDSITSKKEDSRRREILNSNPSLKKQYSEIVEEGKVITPDEFWDTRKILLAEVDAKEENDKPVYANDLFSYVHEGMNDTQNEINKLYLEKKKKMETSGSGDNNIAENKSSGDSNPKYKLNASTINYIFRMYPPVKRAYSKKVPTEMTQKEFWQKYFTSKYFSSNQGKIPAQMAEKNVSGFDELETDYIKDDTIIKAGQLDPSFDLASTFGDYHSTNLEETNINNIPAVRYQKDKPIVDQAKKVVDLFNRHGSLVLDKIRPNADLRARNRMTEAVSIPDLEGPKKLNYNPLNMKSNINIFDDSNNVKKNNLYDNSSSFSSQQKQKQHMDIDDDEALLSTKITKKKLSNYEPSLTEIFTDISHNTAVDTLEQWKKDSSIADMDMYKDNNENQKKREFEKLQDHFSIISELCRHFYIIIKKGRRLKLKSEDDEKLKWIMKSIHEKQKLIEEIRNTNRADQNLMGIIVPLLNQLHATSINYDAFKESQKNNKNDNRNSMKRKFT